MRNMRWSLDGTGRDGKDYSYDARLKERWVVMRQPYIVAFGHGGKVKGLEAVLGGLEVRQGYLEGEEEEVK